MALVPKGAKLISKEPPGFRIENVFVMAGIPEILYEIFPYVESRIENAYKILSKNLTIYTYESSFAKELSDLQNKYKTIEIGSYPFMKDGNPAADIVFRGKDSILIQKAYEEFKKMIKSSNCRCE